MWGWTDPETGREYAVQSLSDAVAFIDLSDPVNPVFVGHLPAPATNLLWRDLKVFNNHVYIVGDFSPTGLHGLQIFDLTRLRDAGPFEVFTEDAVYTGFDESHNLVINEETGFAYAVASDTCGAEFHILDLRLDPLNPGFVGCFNSGLPGAVHDAQCVIYKGPDAEHRGKEICLAFMEDQFSIIDMTDKSGPTDDLTGPRILATRVYQGLGYVHQGWFDESQAFVASNDELDELNAFTDGDPHNTHTYIWNATDLDDPVHIGTYVGPTVSIDHNHYFKGRFLHQTNYTAGYRVLDATDIANGNLSEIAFFDTFPPDTDAAPVFAGLWSGYPYFESGVVAVSQIDGGELFVLRPDLPPTAMALEVDPGAVASDGNDVFEPGETVQVAPAWRNDDATSEDLQGTASGFTGPDGADYTLVADGADYGTLDPGETASCRETGVCYQMGVDDPALRPAKHWDAAFEETLSDDTSKTWTLHIGDSFADVATTSPFYRFIETIFHHGVTAGCASADYCPAASTTRAQMAVFVLRALEGAGFQPPACQEGEEMFSDVPASSPFCRWIEELASRQVLAGCGGSKYCPATPVTRAQMSVFTLKTLEGAGFRPPACQEGSETFADVPASSPFCRWIEELARRGVVVGCGGGNYCPANPVTRAQMAVFLSKTFGLVLYGP